MVLLKTLGRWHAGTSTAERALRGEASLSLYPAHHITMGNGVRRPPALSQRENRHPPVVRRQSGGQPYTKGRPHRVAGDLANGDRVMNNTLWIAIYPGLTEMAQSFIAERLRPFRRR